MENILLLYLINCRTVGMGYRGGDLKTICLHPKSFKPCHIEALLYSQWYEYDFCLYHYPEVLFSQRMFTNIPFKTPLSLRRCFFFRAGNLY